MGYFGELSENIKAKKSLLKEGEHIVKQIVAFENMRIILILYVIFKLI